MPAGDRGADRPLLRATRWDVSIAMAIAGTVNLCILLLAAANLAGVEGTDSLEGAYAALGVALGPAIATLFAVGLLASGLASTSVGAYAGAEIMHGLLHIRVPLVAASPRHAHPRARDPRVGFDPTISLVLSQVVLSFGIPFALIPLVSLTARPACSAGSQPLGDDGRGDRGLGLPHHAERRAALARVHRRLNAAGWDRPGCRHGNCGTRGGRLWVVGRRVVAACGKRG